MDQEDRDHFKTIARASAGPLQGSQKPQSEETSRSGHDRAYLAKKVATIFACYRKDEAHNPEMYAAAVTAVMSDFPREVIDFVIDPRTGILGVSKFMPSVAEIKEACENAHRKMCEDRERERRIQAQLAARDEVYVSPLDAARLKQVSAAWLDRSDPRAQELAGSKPKAPPTEDEKRALTDDAKAAGAAISGMQLRPETLDHMRSVDAVRSMDEQP